MDAARAETAKQAEEYNKGVGGEIFFPPLARLKDEFVPDWITVAYGTNDWAWLTREEIKKNCTAFYSALRENYPNVPIFAVTPVWRADSDTVRACGSFSEVDRIITESVSALPGVYVVHGWDLIPHDTAMFGDERLHPSDEGFAHYAQNLYNAMKLYLDEEIKSAASAPKAEA
jgi:hypothetical protein